MRIWLNHWFSTAYHLIHMMRKGYQKEVTFVGSSTNPEAIYKRACEEWYLEPKEIEAADYIEFCIKFCSEHHIDLFVPRRFLTDIVKAAERFERIGVKLFADKCYEKVAMLDNKQETYQFFKKSIPEYIPEIRIAHSYSEFLMAYHELSEQMDRVCYKLVIDEGAKSFRVIDNSIEQLSALLNKPGMKITFDAAKHVLETYDFAIPILLMPYLSGVEVSADCLATSLGNLIIPRYKMNKRYSEVIFDPSMLELCGKIMDTLQMQTPMNIQLKYHKDKLYLLEINPRMSGGLQLSCKAAKINLPAIALNEFLGNQVDWSYPQIKAQKVAHIETPILV